MSEKGDTVDASAILKALDTGKKSLATARTLVAQIERLDRERLANLAKLQEHARRLQKVATEGTGRPSALTEVAAWADDYLEMLQRAQSSRSAAFGAELERELSRHDIQLTGQAPELRALFFTIEIDLDHDRARLWYGPKHERLEDVPLDPARVAERLQKLEKELGSGLAPPDFADRLEEAHRRARGDDSQGAPVGLTLTTLAFLNQDKRFHDDPRRENYRSYGRADFAEDLYHARGLGRFHLVTAVRALTRRRSDFLWVPSDRAGNGIAVSHIRISEENA